MFDHLLDAWAYWDWFLIRQGVKGGNNRVQRSFAQGALSTVIPAIGVGSILTILFRTVGVHLSSSNKTAIIWVVLALVLMLAFAGSRRGKQRKAEFENYDKERIQRCDRYVWIFTLASIAMMVLMGVVVTHISASGQPLP
jgi:amino acid transporter